MAKFWLTITIIFLCTNIYAQEQKVVPDDTEIATTEEPIKSPLAQLTTKIIRENKLCFGDILAIFEPNASTPNGAQNLLNSLCLSKFSIAREQQEETELTGTIEHKDKEIPVSITINSTPTDKSYLFALEPGQIKLSTYIPILTSLEKFAQLSDLRIGIVVPKQKTASTTMRIRLSTIATLNIDKLAPLALKITLDIPSSTQKMSVKAEFLDTATQRKYCLVPDAACITVKHTNLQLAENEFSVTFEGEIQVLNHTNNGQLNIASKNGKIQAAICANISEQTTLGAFSNHFSSLDNIVTINNATLAVATANTQLSCGANKTIKAGINLDATVSFKGTVGAFFKKIGIDTLHTIITIPSTPTKIEDLQIVLQKDFDTAQKIGPIAIKSVDMRIAGGRPTPKVGLSLAAQVTPPGSTDILDIVFSGDISATSVDLGGSAICKINKSEKSCAAIKEPFGLPFTLVDPAFEIKLTEGTPTGFSIKGDAKLGNSAIKVDCKIDLINPTESAVDIQAKHLCLSDLSVLWISIANKVGKKINIPTITIPSFACFDDSSIHASITQFIPEIAITLNFNLLGVKALLDGTLDISGLALQGSMDPISKAGLFSLTSHDNPNKGPSLELQLNLLEQKATIDGKMNMINGLISRDVHINVTDQGLHFETEVTIAGNQYKIMAQFPIEPETSIANQDWQLNGEVTLGFADLIIKGLKNSAEAAVAEIEKPINDMENAKKACDKAPIPLNFVCQGAFEIAASPLQLAKLTVNTVKNGFTQAINTLRIKKASFSASLSQIKTGLLPVLQIDLMLLNKPLQINIENFDIKNPINSLTQVNKVLAQNVLSNVISPTVNSALETLKKTVDKIKGVFK